MAMTRERYDELVKDRVKQYSVTKSGYRVVLTPHFEKNSNMTIEELKKVDSDNSPIEFDIVNSKTVESSSKITDYPMVNGDTVADHMIRQPVSISISGVYSMYGNKPTSFKGENDRLTNIEALFERIKDEGVMCSIVTIDRGSNSKQRFKARNNMVLTRISWTESQASLSFSFDFTEALTVELNDIQVDYTDENLPAITDAASLDFTDIFIDYNQVTEICIQQLDSLGLMQDKFWPNVVYWLKTVGETNLSTRVGAAVVGVPVGIATLLTISAIVGTVPVAGWIATGIISGVTAVAGAIWALVSSIKKKKAERDYAVNQFKIYKDENKQKQENERFANYIGNIHLQIKYLDDVIKVYGISSDEEQECMLFVDDEYYVFTFKKNNTQSTSNNVVWGCDITNISIDDKVGNIDDVSSYALSNISECTSTNNMFKTKNGYYVYLINKKLFAIENADYSSDEERNNAITECKNDLTNICVLVSTINMDNFNDTLRDVVINAMKR